MGQHLQHIQGFFGDKRGAALTEFALVLPILVVMMSFIGEFSRAVYQYHVAEKGVKSAARYLARVPDVTVCASSSFDSYKSDAIALAQKGSFDAGDPFVLNNWTSAADVQVVVTCIANPIDPNTNLSPFYGPEQIPVITVSTTFDFNDLGMLNVIKLLRPGNQDRGAIEISASHREIYVGD